ncbi:succinylglutamate desuccinylase/aspartoacylase family protein [Maricaulis sp. CAU 1757]
MRAPFEMAGASIAPGTTGVIDLPVSVLSDHTPMALNVHVIHGKREGPTVFVSAAVHGDEIIGVEIIRRLIRTPQLKSIAGTLICVPVVNTFGFISHSRYLPDRRDLNRSFPGGPSGSLAARLAHLFMTEVVGRCDAGVDLHSAAVNRTNLPQIRVDTAVPEALRLAEVFSAPVIVHSALREGSLREAAQALGKPVIVYESGEALRFDETALRMGVKGVLRVLGELGMIRSDKRLKPALTPEVSDKSVWVRAAMGGVLRMHRSIGQHVAKGEVIGTLSDPLGEKEREVKAPAAGLIVGRTVLPIVNEGDAIFHIAEIMKRRNEEPLAHITEALGRDPLFDEDEII